MTTFGQTIREARIKRGLSFREFAKQVGIGANRLFDYEHGHLIPSTLERIAQIAEALDIDFDLLRARAGWLTEKETAYLKSNPKLVKLIAAMIAARFGEEETERLLKEVKKRKKR